MAILTLDTLRAKGACQEQTTLFRKTFGEQVDVTPALCVQVADQFDWTWAAHNLLDPDRCVAYHQATAPARAAYYQAVAAAYDAYHQATAAARAAYGQALAAADAAYGKAIAPAYVAYRQEIDAADAAYRQAIAAADAAVDQATAEAFGRLYDEQHA